MRKIPGLQICYRTATGGISLPPEFLGQPAEFRASVLHDWCKDIMSERDAALEAVSAGTREIYSKGKSHSLQAILDSGWAVVCMRLNETTGKRAVFAFRKAQAGMEACIFESFGEAGFAPVYSTPLQNCGAKRIHAIASAALKEWDSWRRFTSIKGAIPASINTFSAWKAAIAQGGAA